MSAAHWSFWNDDAKPSSRLRGDQSVYAPIRLTINEIVQIPSSALVPALIENPAPLEVIGKEAFHFPGCRFPKFALFDIASSR